MEGNNESTGIYKWNKKLVKLFFPLTAVNTVFIQLHFDTEIICGVSRGKTAAAKSAKLLQRFKLT